MSLRFPAYTPTRFYILTAADGFTTICDATIPALRIEVTRSAPLAPITVDDWLRDLATHYGDWTKVGSFMWP